MGFRRPTALKDRPKQGLRYSLSLLTLLQAVGYTGAGSVQGQEDQLPLYEYQCQECKAYFEKIRKFSDPPLRKCEKCGGKLERLLSSPAIQFKGSGWYVTDYARKSAPETNKGPAETAAKASDGKGDAGAKSSGNGKPSEGAKTPQTSTADK